jgi:putative NIF3 family GTP cyclohydrolase 1 type 2
MSKNNEFKSACNFQATKHGWVSAGFFMIFLLASHFSCGQQSRLTAAQVIERIQEKSGVPWSSPTVDVFKTGNPALHVTGIVTTMFATYSILEQAVALGCNLIITHEPTFYNHLDDTVALVRSNDQVYAQKRKFIEDNKLIIWRFHDHIHMLQPDGITVGVVRRLGWEKYQDASNRDLFRFPEVKLSDLANSVKKSLEISSLRVIGNPDLIVSRVALAPGAPGSESQIYALEQEQVDVLLIGESHEWETIEYARDAVEQGKKKAVIILGHVPSEEAGMEECARWLSTFIKEVPVKYVQTREPYWVIK